MSRSQEIMEDEQPKIDDTVKELPEVQAAIKEHEENNKNAEEKQDERVMISINEMLEEYVW